MINSEIRQKFATQNIYCKDWFCHWLFYFLEEEAGFLISMINILVARLIIFGGKIIEIPFLSSLTEAWLISWNQYANLMGICKRYYSRNVS